MLEESGYGVEVIDAGIDDGLLKPGLVPPAWWVAALALLKATAGADEASRRGLVFPVIGGDTVCVHRGKIIGQPEDARHAWSIIDSFRNARHAVLTGVAVVDQETGERRLAVDVAWSSLGDLPDSEIDAYVASNDWRGKAGAYNLTERIAAGWPIEFEGDPDTIVGLPRRLLPELLAGCRVATGGAA